MAFFELTSDLDHADLRGDELVDAFSLGVEKRSDPPLFFDRRNQDRKSLQVVPSDIELRWRHPLRHPRQLSQVWLTVEEVVGVARVESRSGAADEVRRTHHTFEP
jgi:hypothetical protein